MSHDTPDAPMAEMVGRWCDLALRRRAHFVELYDSGRWERYYSEAEFAGELRKLGEMVERWKRIAMMSTSNIRAKIEPKLRADLPDAA